MPSCGSVCGSMWPRQCIGSTRTLRLGKFGYAARFPVAAVKRRGIRDLAEVSSSSLLILSYSSRMVGGRVWYASALPT